MATHETALVTRAARAALLRGIYAIVNEGVPDPIAITRAALEGGVGIVQYRAKRGIVPEHLQAMRALTRDACALLIVNDDWRAARDHACDGVHLGPDDDGFLDVAPIRAALPQALIGLSCGTPEELRAAERLDVDYYGVGAVYATASKADAGAPIGIAGLRAVVAESTRPVAAIGGIALASIDEVRATGVAMAAVISAISAAPDPRAASAALVRGFRG
ncbi:MAG: thiamine phosphate synthase [bacterium]|nr:thiamine phosphate synthase [bacterium]